jgi:UDP-4-amino-4,6-dideoxy-N-acetyl-beta-L-altrosamine transaminase
MLSYARQWIGADDRAAVAEALNAERITQGERVCRFEEAVAKWCGARYAVAVNSGTSALHIACLAAGLRQGDEGITSPITFVASANSMLYCGAKPVFADIDDETVCVSPESIASKITPRTRIIMPVHFGGHPCAMDEISRIARKRGIVIIEDACHALGALFHGSRIGSCSYSDMTVFSFHAVKHITTGEGGMVMTNNRGLYDKLLMLRSHGIVRTGARSRREPWYYEMRQLGFNYRLTDIQCALGLSQLKKLDVFVSLRRKMAGLYTDAFKDIEGLRIPVERSGSVSSYHLYVVRFPRSLYRATKSEIAAFFGDRGIGVNVHYIPVYLQPYYKALGYRKGSCPTAERYYEEAITIPLFPRMSDRDARRVINVTKNACRVFARRQPKRVS